jgi:hypothetical protein
MRPSRVVRTRFTTCEAIAQARLCSDFATCALRAPVDGVASARDRSGFTRVSAATCARVAQGERWPVRCDRVRPLRKGRGSREDTMFGRKLGSLGGAAVVLGMVAVGAGCAASAGPDVPEKTAASNAALIQSNPNPIATFPDGNSSLPACARRTPIRVGAFPTHCQYDANGNPIGDTYCTPYTHGHMFGVDCSTNNLYCQHQQDLWSIPNAHGFKYMVAQFKYFDPSKGYGVLDSRAFYLQGIQRVDESYWMTPWNYNGAPAPWTILNLSSHPPYGSDYKSADWLQLWNETWTYSDDPKAPHYLDGGQQIQSKALECVEVWGQNPSSPNLFTRVDFFVAADDYDPTGSNW